MKTASSALTTYINQVRAAPDATMYVYDCFQITLAQTGTVLSWTNADFPITWNGLTYSCTGPLIQGLKLKQTVGLEVDKQQITIAARPTDLISGAAALQAIAQGAFDGATIERHRVFLNSPGGTVIGGVKDMFYGRVSTVDSIGRTRAQITVASSLIVLDYDMPRNTFQATCNHTLYDSGCGVVKGTYSTSSTVGAGSNASFIVWAGILPAHLQGKVTFTSGVNANISATVKSVFATSFGLAYPLPEAPAAGDAFTISYGCDHTPNTCQSRFVNLTNFRGFPYVPPPEIAY